MLLKCNSDGENVSTLSRSFVFPPPVLAVTLTSQLILSWSQLLLTFFKKQRQWAKPSIQRQLVSRKALNVGEVCIPRATSKDRLLTAVSELISSYKDRIPVLAPGSLALLIVSRCLFTGKGSTQEDPIGKGEKLRSGFQMNPIIFSSHHFHVCDFLPFLTRRGPAFFCH